jgi:CubicO group peptidase (beta-lactamase class C family)
MGSERRPLRRAPAPACALLALRFAPALALLLALALAGCLRDDPLKIAYNDTPAPLDDGWPISAPQTQGIAPSGLRAAYERFFSEDDFVTARSLLVVSHGYLVAEGYCRDRADIGRRYAIQSATKSVTSLLAGICIDRGLLDRVDRPLADFIGDEFPCDPQKLTITLRDLLTMRSGIDFDNDHFTMEMAYDVRGDGVAHILRKPLIHAPGSTYNYQDCDPHLLGAALERVTGMQLREFAAVHLFAKLDIRDPIWLAHADGTTYGAYGLYLTPREMARIGKLMAQRGRWEGEQVVSQAWIDESTALQTQMTPQDQAAGFEYGYYWWRVPELGAFTAYGHGGQYIFVVPSRDLAIVMTAEPDTDAETVAIGLTQFLELARIVIAATEAG